MRTVSDIEQEQVAYRADATRNSIHRSSLMVPQMPDAEAEVSFLNHFLIKRGCKHVGCRVTALDGAGQRIESRLIPITEPRAYRVQLDKLFTGASPRHYMVEFFAPENIAIPFPAVMVNHLGADFLNTVHAYNRVLNDIFEDDQLSNVDVREAAVDVRVGGGYDTFAVVTAGPARLVGDLEIELASERQDFHGTLALDLPRFAHRCVSLREVFPELPAETAGILRVRQPRQPMFFGRLMAGQRLGKAFAANHSYYDTSGTPEYYQDGGPSWWVHPHVPGLTNRIRIYPITAPSRLRFDVVLNDYRGRAIARLDAGTLVTPGRRHIDFDIGEGARAASVNERDISAVVIEARSVDGRIPTRISYQLVYTAGGLDASVAMGLLHGPDRARGFCWGQIPVGRGLHTWLGVTADLSADETNEIKLDLYGASGLLTQRTFSLARGAGVLLDSNTLFPEIGTSPETHFLWYMLTGPRKSFSAVAVTRHASGHCTAEHSF